MAVHGIIGKKVGMTQIFTADGTVVPVTVVQAGPCLVVQKKTADKEGYDALQIGLVGSRPDRRANSAAKGHFEKAGVAPMRTLMEVRADKGDELKPGDKILCDMFAEQDHVDVVGTSKGKGFMGVVARHGFWAARRRTARCSTGRPDPSALRHSRRACTPARARRDGWVAASRRARTSSSSGWTPRRTSSTSPAPFPAPATRS